MIDEKEARRLNELATEYFTLKEQKANSAAAKGKQMVLLEQSYQYMLKMGRVRIPRSGEPVDTANQKKLDLIQDVILEALRLFDPQKGQYTAFLVSRRKKRENDKKNTKEQSLEALLEPKEDRASSGLERDYSVRIEEDAIARESALELIETIIAMIINFVQHREEYKPTKQKQFFYHRMFYTAGATKGIKEEGYQFRHIRDMFAAMDTDFLNSYMEHDCFSLADIYDTELDWYGKVIPNRPMDQRVPLPVPGDVYCAYADCSEAAVSQHRKQYEALMRTIRDRA